VIYRGKPIPRWLRGEMAFYIFLRVVNNFFFPAAQWAGCCVEQTGGQTENSVTMYTKQQSAFVV
jgi:hypothetical protein